MVLLGEGGGESEEGWREGASKKMRFSEADVYKAPLISVFSTGIRVCTCVCVCVWLWWKLVWMAIVFFPLHMIGELF